MLVRRFVAPVLTVLVVLVGACPSALADGAPRWQITAFATPTSFTPNEGEEKLAVFVSNVGGAASNGTPITLSATLAPGVTVKWSIHGTKFKPGIAVV